VGERSMRTISLREGYFSNFRAFFQGDAGVRTERGKGIELLNDNYGFSGKRFDWELFLPYTMKEEKSTRMEGSS
jgi:hypothetical protein